MFTILEYSSALEYSIIRRYTNIVYYLLLLLRICGAMGGLKQTVTRTQGETAEIIQQCNMEEGIQPRAHLCIVKHFGYV